MIVTDLDGNPVADRRVKARAARLEWKYRTGSWREEEVDVQECIVGSAQEPVGCSFETTATLAPASCASIAARIPAHPAPTTTTS